MESIERKHDFDLFVGGKVGSFKGISISIDDQNIKPVVKNIQNLDVLTKEHEITTLSWGDPEELDVLIGLASQKVKIYDTDFKAFTSSMDVNCGKGKICGLSRFRRMLVTAVESGHVKIWNTNKSDNILETGCSIEKMRHSAVNPDIIATGGKENELALWNLETMECTFKAKNVRPDMLQLRVPVWVSDMDFLPGSSKAVVCTRHGHVRLYDPGTPQKRPVLSMDIPEQTLTALAITSRDHHVVVGSGKGKIMLVDLRKKGSVVQHYKGAVGAVKSIACHRTQPYLVSVGFDRNLLVHNLNSKALIRKMYLKARLNSILLRSDAFLKIVDAPIVKDEDYIEVIEDDYDELFDNMETIQETSPRKKCKIK